MKLRHTLMFVPTLLSQAIWAEQIGHAGVLAGLRGEVQIYRAEDSLRATGGDPVYVGDRIISDGGQLFQLLLRDETTFTFGAGSDVSLDEYEYSDSEHKGHLLLTQRAGLMKFATGKIADGTTGAFRINQPNTQIAVLGTMGVTAILTSEEASTYFPDISLPETNDAVNYAALMGPGPLASRITSTGTFVVTAGETSLTVNQPGGSVLTAGNSEPVFFVAPPLLLFTAKSDNDDKEAGSSESKGSNNDSAEDVARTTSDSSSLRELPTIQAKSFEQEAPAGSRMSGSSTSAQRGADSPAAIRDILSTQRMQEMILRMEETFGVPEEFSSGSVTVPTLPGDTVTETITDPIIDPITDPVVTDPVDPVVDPIEPEPIEPEPIDPSPVNPDPVEPTPVEPTPVDPVVIEPYDPGFDPGGGVMCPGDPECP
ncbi:MAG: hypothetical protein VW258_06765 [Thalassolituus sp.]